MPKVNLTIIAGPSNTPLDITINEYRRNFTPNYLYSYLIELETKLKIKIGTIYFKENSFYKYKLKDLKGRYDWDELK